MLKLSENPPSLPPGITGVGAIDGDWWVGHTKSRFEKSFAWDLLAQGTNYFLPMVQKILVYKGHKRKTLAPVFPSYVFFAGVGDQRYRAMTTNRLCQVIPVRDRERFVAELVAVEKALAGGAPLCLYPFAVVGKRCRVARGALEGIEGVVVQIKGVSQLVLQVSMLGQAVSVEIDSDLLEAID